MKGDIAFVGFMMTADEWQELDAQSRAQLIAVATRRMEQVPETPRRFPEGTGKHEVIDFIDSELEQALELLDDDLGQLIEPPAAAPPIDDDLDFSGL
jgi:hypothetical protein